MIRLSLLVLALAAAVTAAPPDFRTGHYHGRAVTFQNIGGLAVYQGDIILGTTEEVSSAVASDKSNASSTVSSTRLLWPGGVIPYTIDSALPQTQRNIINQAIDHWNSKTPIHLTPRTNEFNYVNFTTGTSTIACSSNVGMVGGQQSIRLPTGCGVGETIHEIGHAVGLWHEQSRNDRNRLVTILYENIDKPSWTQFDQVLSSGTDAGPYDIYSIMHYGAYDFSRDGLSPAMETVPAGMPMGQRIGLSAGDLDAIQRLYGQAPARTTIATAPAGQKVLVDGALVDDGTSFDWSPGSTHTLEAPFQGDDSNRYLFGAWSDGGAMKHTIQASANTTVYIANFVVQRKITPFASPSGAGTVTIEPASADGFYTDRSYLRITATPIGNYNFLAWSVNPSRSLNPKYVNIRAAQTIFASFTTTNVTTITSNPIGRTAIVDGGSYTTPVSFAWSKGDTHAVGFDTTQPNFIHYRFDGWSDGGSAVRTITASGNADTYTGNFTTRYSLSFSITPRLSLVNVSPDPADGFYDAGTEVQVTALPTQGLALLRWGGDLGGNQLSATLTMDDQKLVTALFVSSSAIPKVVAVNSASSFVDPDFSATPVAPGEVVTIYGSGLGPDALFGAQVSNGKLTTQLVGTRVLFSGIASPMVYTSANQVSAIVPYEIAANPTTNLQVEYNGKTTTPVTMNVIASTPGIFTADSSGKGGGAILNPDGQLNTPSNPASRGDIVAMWVTGEGVVTPAATTGQITGVAVLPKPVLPVSVRIGGKPAAIHYAGAAPFTVAGVMQVNFQIPDGVQPGPRVPIAIAVGDQISPPGITIAIQ